MSEIHEHPLTEGEAIVENAFIIPYASEGCEEHYAERVIKEDASYSKETEKAKIDNPYLNAIIIGEALATPRCKKPFWKK